jgi:hypothetical protein
MSNSCPCGVSNRAAAAAAGFVRWLNRLMRHAAAVPASDPADCSLYVSPCMHVSPCCLAYFLCDPSANVTTPCFCLSPPLHPPAPQA